MSNIASEMVKPQGSTGKFGRFMPAVVRVLLGLMFLVFGLNGFLNFMPAPKDMPQEIMTVVGSLMQAGYMTVVSGAEVVIAVGEIAVQNEEFEAARRLQGDFGARSPTFECDHLMPVPGKTRRGNGSDVAEAQYADFHDMFILRRPHRTGHPGEAAQRQMCGISGRACRSILTPIVVLCAGV